MLIYYGYSLSQQKWVTETREHYFSVKKYEQWFVNDYNSQKTFGHEKMGLHCILSCNIIDWISITETDN